MLVPGSSALFRKGSHGSNEVQPVLPPLGGAVPLKTAMLELGTPPCVCTEAEVCLCRAPAITVVYMTSSICCSVEWKPAEINDDVLEVFTCKWGGISGQRSVMNHKASQPGQLSEFLIYNSHCTPLLCIPSHNWEKLCAFNIWRARYFHKNYLLLLSICLLKCCQVLMNIKCTKHIAEIHMKLHPYSINAVGNKRVATQW